MQAHKVIETLGELDPINKDGELFLKSLAADIKASIKFQFDVVPQVKDVGFCNLPFPIVYFEVPEEKVAFIAEQKEKDAEITIACVCQFKPSEPMYPYDTITKIRKEQDGRLIITGAQIVGIEDLSEEQMRDRGNGIVRDFMLLCELLSCSNVETVNNDPPKFLNRKRIKKGKLPLFEYKTLTIKHSGSPAVAILDGERNSPRLHLRRGHIRRHPTAGKVWVRDCVVGKADNGVIEKDYKVAS